MSSPSAYSPSSSVPADKPVRRVVFLCKSDNVGGAAIVTHRLMQAIAHQGVDARMLVVNKGTADDRVATVGSRLARRYAFYAERLKLYLRGGFNRRDLFKVSTASDGVAVASHPWVKQADVVCLSWVNQGLLSLKGWRRLLRMDKQFVAIMHDLWYITGICHLPASCTGYHVACGHCPYLNWRGPRDLSHRVWQAKARLYATGRMQFVAVSSWVAARCRESSLLGSQRVIIVPNPLPVARFTYDRTGDTSRCVIAMGAARLDDPVKGFDLMIAAANHIVDHHPQVAAHMHLLLFGHLRRPEALDALRLSHTWLGPVAPADVPGIYRQSDVVLSASHFETFGATLAEGMAAGCRAVSFDQGGQCDIIDHLDTGYLAHYPDVDDLARGLVWAAEHPADRARQHRIAVERFDDARVARRFLQVLQ